MNLESELSVSRPLPGSGGVTCRRHDARLVKEDETEEEERYKREQLVDQSLNIYYMQKQSVSGRGNNRRRADE